MTGDLQPRPSGKRGKRKRVARRESTEAPSPASAQRVYYYYFAFAALLVYVAFEVYGRALHGPFVYDDFNLPYYKRDFRTDDFIAWISTVRPMLMFSYWANFQISGRDTYSYHLLNLLLHVANSGAIFLIARQILRQAAIEEWRLNILSVFASALFLFHPIQTESVAYVAGRSEVLSAFFFLYAFVIFLYKSPQAAIGWGRSALILVVFGCALATKEHTATLPILFLMTDLFWSSENPVAVVRRNWRLYLPILCGAFVAARLIWIEVNGSTSAGLNNAGVNWLAYAQTECGVFFRYLQLVFFPVGQNFDPDLPWSPNHFEPAAFALFLVILALAVFAWRLRKRFPVGSWGLLVFMLLLAPTSSLIPIKDAIAEHRLYLSMLGFVFMACELMIQLIRAERWTVAVASIVLLAASIATYHRNGVWASETALWEDTVAKSPNKLRGYAHLVHGLVQERRCREALDRLSEMSHRLKPDATLLANWSVAYECVNEPEHALELLRQSAATLPWPSTYVNMARHQAKLNRVPDAIQSLGKAIELDPTLESAYLLRADLYLRQGDSLAAAKDYGHALLKGHIDVPLEGANLSGKALAGGWTISKASPIAEIWIYMDARPLTKAILGVARPDVAKVFPTESWAPTSGWNAIFDTAGTPPGQHTLTVRAKLQDGTFLDASSVKIEVSK